MTMRRRRTRRRMRMRRRRKRRMRRRRKSANAPAPSARQRGARSLSEGGESSHVLILAPSLILTAQPEHPPPFAPAPAIYWLDRIAARARGFGEFVEGRALS
eukprot:4766469-Pyramimonas_sp.AAC.1